MPLLAFGVENSTLDLFVEEDMIASSLAQKRLTEADASSVLFYEGADQASEIDAVLKGLPGLSLGHAMPYVYVAVNHAVDSMMRSVMAVPHSREEARAASFGVDPDGDGFKNLRDLIPAKAVRGQRLRVEAYFTRKAFEAAAGGGRYDSGAHAFWDPGRTRIGFLVDGSVFRWLPYRAAQDQQSSERAAVQIRDYVNRRTIEAAGRDLFGFVQSITGSPVYAHPFLATATARFVQESSLSREEMRQLEEAQSVRGLPRALPSTSPCGTLVEKAPPLGLEAMYRLSRAAPRVRAGLDIEGLLLATAASADRGRVSGADDADALGPAVLLFVSTLPRERFLAHFGPLTAGAGADEARAAIRGVNQLFGTWWSAFAGRWWGDPRGAQIYELVANSATNCLNNRYYTAALAGARLMGAMRPESPTPLVYAGDAFWRVQYPIFALDDYTRALGRAETYGYADEPRSRPASRLGDVYETLGDLPAAIEVFSRLDRPSVEEQDPGPLIIILRSRLKGAFYKRLLQSHREQSADALLFVNAYVALLQFGGCPDAAERARIEELRALVQSDEPAFLIAFAKHFEALKARMTDFDASADFAQLLQARRSYCR